LVGGAPLTVDVLSSYRPSEGERSTCRGCGLEDGRRFYVQVPAQVGEVAYGAVIFHGTWAQVRSSPLLNRTPFPKGFDTFHPAREYAVRRLSSGTTIRFVCFSF